MAYTHFTVEIHPDIPTWDDQGAPHSVQMRMYVTREGWMLGDSGSIKSKTAHYWCGLDSVTLETDGSFLRASDGHRLWPDLSRVQQ